MDAVKYISISDFAKLSRTTRKTLLYYDKIGLLSPSTRGTNKYRYYSVRQLELVNLIRTLQNLGLSLDEIREIKDRRTPQYTSGMLGSQIEQIDKEIEHWNRARKLLRSLKQMIDATSNINEEEIEIKHLPASAIVLGELNDYSAGENDYDALAHFYENLRRNHPNIDINYPVWAIFSRERIERRDWNWPDRYYLNNPDGYDSRPPALYAIGYSHGKYGQSDGLYDRILKHIDECGFEVSGDAYEEYPLNEICVTDENEYLVRVMITVRERLR